MIDRKKMLKILAVLFFVLVFLNDTTVYNVYFGDISSKFTIGACIILTFFIILSKKIYIGKKFWFFIVFWLTTILISCSMAGVTNFLFIRIAYWTITVIMVSTMYVAGINLKDTIYTVSKIFCIWCLACYFYTCFGFDFLPVTHTSEDLAYNFYRIDLYGFFISKPISHISITSFLTFLRLDRPFGEPGIAQIFMNYGLIYNIFFIENKKERKWFYLFTLGSLCSFSLIGYAILLSIFFFKLYKEKKYVLLFMFVFVALSIGSIMIIEKMSSFSYSDRMEDYTHMFNTIVDNLPFGIGIGNTGNIERYKDTEFSKGYYCGLLYPLMQYGLWGIVYYWALFKSIIYNSNNKKNKVIKYVLGIFIVLTLLTEPQADEPIILCFIFDGLINFFDKNKFSKEVEVSICNQ